MAFKTVRVTGRYVGMDGEPCTGKVTFTPPCVVRDNSGHAIVAGPITAELEYMGFLDVELPCTDQDGMNPTGWAYQVTERLDCADCVSQYRMSVPCGDAPAPAPAAVAVCADDGYTVGVSVESTVYPVTVDWGDGSVPDVMSRGQDSITHTYWQEGMPLDPSRPSAPVFPALSVPLSQSGSYQQAAADPLSGDWYASQIPDGGQTWDGETVPLSWTERNCQGDMVFNRLTADGELLSHMNARRFDHGQGLAVERDGETLYLWCGTDAVVCTTAGQHGKASKVGRFTYAADTVLDVGDPSMEIFDPFPQYGTLTLSIDQAHGTIAVQCWTGVPQEKRVAVWTLEDFLNHDFSSPIYDTYIPYEHRQQSWVLYGGYYYAFHGVSGGDPAVPKYFYVVDLATGSEVATYDNPPRTGFDYQEAEAITVRDSGDGPQVVWGIAVSTPDEGGRRMALYAGEPHRAQQDVTITVTDASGASSTAVGVDHIPCLPSR